MPDSAWHNNFAEFTELVLERWFSPRKRPRDAPESGISDAPCYILRINADWLPDVIGALAVLDQQDAWLGDDDAIYRARSEVNKLIAQLERCCCDMKALRQKPGNRAILQYQDCDDVWHDAFDYAFLRPVTAQDIRTQDDVGQYNHDIYNTYNFDTVENIWEQANEFGDDIRNTVLCFAISVIIRAICAGAVTAIQDSGDESYNRYTSIVLTVSGAAAAGFAVVAAVTGGFALGILAAAEGLSVALAAIDLLLIEGPEPEDYAYLQDEAAQNNVACNVYAQLHDTTIEFDDWQAAFEDNPFDAGSNEDKILTIAQSAVNSIQVFLALIDAMGKAWNAADAGIALPCPCEEWCYNFDFTDDNEYWDASADWTQGHYIASTGWSTNDEFHNNAGRRAVRIEVSAAITTITKFSMTYNYTKGTIAADYTAFFLEINGVRVLEKRYSQMVNGNGQTIEWEGNQNTDGNGIIRVFLSASLDTSSPYTYSGSALITNIETQGNGFSPFSGSNCVPD